MAVSLEQGYLHALPCTPKSEAPTPALTPSSELSEEDLGVPATPTADSIPRLCLSTDVDKQVSLDDSCTTPDSAPHSKRSRAERWDATKSGVECPISCSYTASTSPVAKGWLLSCYQPRLDAAPTKPAASMLMSFSVCPDFDFSAKPLTRPPRTRKTLTSPQVPTSTTAQVSASQDQKASEKSLHYWLKRAFPCDVLTRLQTNSTRCVAETVSKPSRRCGNSIPTTRLPVLSASTTARAIRAIGKMLDEDGGLSGREAVDEALIRLRGTVIPQVCCTGGQHVRIATEALTEIRARLKMASGHTQLSHAECSAIKSWLRMLTGAHIADARRSPISSPSSLSYAPTAQHGPRARRASVDPAGAADTAANTKVHKIRLSTTSPAFATPRSTQSSITSTKTVTTRDTSPTIVPYHGPNTRIARISVSKRLGEVISRPLSILDLKDGHLYVFWHRGGFGLIKIGWTAAVTRDERLDWWRKCNGDLEDVSEDYRRPVSGDNGEAADTHSPPTRVRNVRRLESLVHAELKDYRRKQLQCAGCGKNHIEWFDVPVNHAQQVVRRWTTWLMAEERYENKVGGKLLSSSSAEIHHLCKPLEFVKEAQKKVIETGRRGSEFRRPSTGAERRTSVPASASRSPAPEMRRRSARIASQQRKSGTLGIFSVNPWSGLTTDYRSGALKAEHMSPGANE
jgi:hypothetical protein